MNGDKIDSTGESIGSFGSYTVGFIFSLVLTVIAFGLVMSGKVSLSTATLGIIGAAIVQIFVHLHYFLHLDTSSAARWNILALLFTLLLVGIFVGGTIWIMYELNYNTM